MKAPAPIRDLRVHLPGTDQPQPPHSPYFQTHVDVTVNATEDPDAPARVALEFTAGWAAYVPKDMSVEVVLTAGRQIFAQALYVDVGVALREILAEGGDDTHERLTALANQLTSGVFDE